MFLFNILSIFLDRWSSHFWNRHTYIENCRIWYSPPSWFWICWRWGKLRWPIS